MFACDDKMEAKPESELVAVELNEDLTTTTSELDDSYLYIKANEFTSEIYKIEVTGMPSKFGFGQLKKLFNNKLRLKSHKIKCPGPNAPFVFVTFKCEADRERALSMLNGYEWKGKCLSAKKASPSADPIVKRNSQKQVSVEPPIKKRKVVTAAQSVSISERLNDAVSPLWKTPYEQQVKEKELSVKQTLREASKKIEGAVGGTKWLLEKKKENGGICFELKPLRPSPVTNGYRNKVEFTVGLAEDDLPTVGFRLSRYVDGCCKVAPVDDCLIIPEAMKRAAKEFQSYVRESGLAPYDPSNYSGYWRQLTVRTTLNNDMMAVAVMHPQSLSEEELLKVKEQLKEYFSVNCPGKFCGITSMYFQLLGKRISGQEIENEHIFGVKHIHETLMDMKFRISPDAFFQTNTAAAEVLYGVVAEECGSAAMSSIVLDVCCGTGTIGMCLAKSVAKVHGIEMVSAAVEDAKYNAEVNGLENVQFTCGKAEDVLSQILGPLIEDVDDVIAVVDPPRAGLHNKVIRTLRSCQKIRRLIYVSCNAKAATTNFVDLCRPPSNNYMSDPFIPVRAIPIDLFPHTSHCEVVLVFERIQKLPLPPVKVPETTKT